MFNPLLERLEKGPILCDGGMGTLLYNRGIYYDVCYEELNVKQPTIIQEIHRDYIAAGSEIIETNTFGANRYRLAHFGLQDKVREFNLKGAKLAREVRDISGESVLVAGSVGPLGQLVGAGGSVKTSEAQAAFKEQIEALMEGGVDLIILETFYNFQEMWQALRTARATTDIPIVAQMTFTDDGRTFSGHTPEEVMQMLRQGGADVIGLNCHVGPQGTLAVLERFASASPAFPYLSAQPNAGAPQRIEGRLFYNATPEYFGQYVRQFHEMGVKIMGGCCGTTPLHIAKMREALKSIRPEEGKTFTPGKGYSPIYSPPHSDVGPDASVHEQVDRLLEKVTSVLPTELAQKLAAGKFVVSIEMGPPKGINPTKMLQATAKMAELGADVVNITDSAMAKVRMGSMACAILIQQSIGIETIIHYTTRDRNLMALQSDLLGAHANGIRNVLALTGDPPSLGDYPGASGIWDVDAIGLIAMLKRFNRGQDWNGRSIGSPANFNVGCAFNPTATDLPTEIERLRKKLAAGAQFIMTQPVFDPKLLRETLQEVGEVKIP
ncbi:MAG: bifunctional homocysteine S-methyltransferase/methylenetetrahydrofolate reductase, partial [Chloroflexota bacterium]